MYVCMYVQITYEGLPQSEGLYGGFTLLPR